MQTILKYHLDESFFGELLVDFRSVGDVLCTVCIIQSGQCLFKVALGRGYGGYDGRLCATTQGVLQDASQLALSVDIECGIFNDT